MSDPSLILASTSPYRRQLLDQLGLNYKAVAHRCDEDSFKGTGLLEPKDLAITLARAKALSLVSDHPEAWILGSDQVACLGDQILSKPGTVQKACEQLAMMQGKTHLLITAVALRCPSGELLEAVQVYKMHMRSLDSEAIARYVAHDQPLDCGGSYKIEGKGIALFEAIEGHDHTSIVGLPLIHVTTMLRSQGWMLP